MQNSLRDLALVGKPAFHPGLAPLLAQVQHGLEAPGPAVVGIRHIRPTRVGKNRKEQGQLRLLVGTGVFAQPVQVALVHRQDPVERLEILGPHPSRLVEGKVESRPFARGAGALVGGFSFVVGLGARGIAGKALLQPPLPDQMAQHRIGRGRAADVSGADEQDANGSGHRPRRYLERRPVQMAGE